MCRRPFPRGGPPALVNQRLQNGLDVYLPLRSTSRGKQNVAVRQKGSLRHPEHVLPGAADFQLELALRIRLCGRSYISVEAVLNKDGCRVYRCAGLWTPRWDLRRSAHQRLSRSRARKLSLCRIL